MSKPKPIIEVNVSAAWHEKIAQQLATPVIPADLPQEARQEIENQQERHKLFAKTLRRIATAAT